MPVRPAIGQQITWVYCDDLDATARFYRETLGLRQVVDEGAARIFQASAGAFVGVCRAFEDRVVDINATDPRFQGDAIAVTTQLTGLSDEAADGLLKRAGGRVRVAPRGRTGPRSPRRAARRPRSRCVRRGLRYCAPTPAAPTMI